jgi:hypothetical protein
MFRNGIPLFEVDNLVVAGATIAAANLAAGVISGNNVLVMGFGSGTTTPGYNDATLSGTAQYYNAVGTHSFPAQGSVLFNFSITATDYAATPGINIQEIGLFGLTNSANVPTSIGIISAPWVASALYGVGATIKDSNNNIQRCTTSGTSGSSQHPVWSTVVGQTTTDNSVTWTLIAGGVVPVPMWSHALVPSFTFTGAANYVGSWTITF